MNASKLDIFEFWTVGHTNKTSEDNTLGCEKLQQAFSLFSNILKAKQIIEKIINEPFLWSINPVSSFSNKNEIQHQNHWQTGDS